MKDARNLWESFRLGDRDTLQKQITAYVDEKGEDSLVSLLKQKNSDGIALIHLCMQMKSDSQSEKVKWLLQYLSDKRKLHEFMLDPCPVERSLFYCVAEKYDADVFRILLDCSDMTDSMWLTLLQYKVDTRQVKHASLLISLLFILDDEKSVILKNKLETLFIDVDLDPDCKQLWMNEIRENCFYFNRGDNKTRVFFDGFRHNMKLKENFLQEASIEKMLLLCCLVKLEDDYKWDFDKSFFEKMSELTNSDIAFDEFKKLQPYLTLQSLLDVAGLYYKKNNSSNRNDILSDYLDGVISANNSFVCASLFKSIFDALVIDDRILDVYSYFNVHIGQFKKMLEIVSKSAECKLELLEVLTVGLERYRLLLPSGSEISERRNAFEAPLLCILGDFEGRSFGFGTTFLSFRHIAEEIFSYIHNNVFGNERPLDNANLDKLKISHVDQVCYGQVCKMRVSRNSIYGGSSLVSNTNGFRIYRPSSYRYLSERNIRSLYHPKQGTSMLISMINHMCANREFSGQDIPQWWSRLLFEPGVLHELIEHFACDALGREAHGKLYKLPLKLICHVWNHLLTNERHDEARGMLSYLGKALSADLFCQFVDVVDAASLKSCLIKMPMSDEKIMAKLRSDSSQLLKWLSAFPEACFKAGCDRELEHLKKEKGSEKKDTRSETDLFNQATTEFYVRLIKEGSRNSVCLLMGSLQDGRLQNNDLDYTQITSALVARKARKTTKRRVDDLFHNLYSSGLQTFSSSLESYIEQCEAFAVSKIDVKTSCPEGSGGCDPSYEKENASKVSSARLLAKNKAIDQRGEGTVAVSSNLFEDNLGQNQKKSDCLFGTDVLKSNEGSHLRPPIDSSPGLFNATPRHENAAQDGYGQNPEEKFKAVDEEFQQLLKQNVDLFSVPPDADDRVVVFENPEDAEEFSTDNVNASERILKAV